jgi:hypothetical protein
MGPDWVQRLNKITYAKSSVHECITRRCTVRFRDRVREKTSRCGDSASAGSSRIDHARAARDNAAPGAAANASPTSGAIDAIELSQCRHARPNR